MKHYKPGEHVFSDWVGFREPESSKIWPACVIFFAKVCRLFAKIINFLAASFSLGENLHLLLLLRKSAILV